MAGASPAAGPAVPPSDVLDGAVAFLLSHQLESGCIGPGSGSAQCSSMLTDWTALALVAAGWDPQEGSPSIVEGLAVAEPVQAPGQAYVTGLERHLLAIVAVGEDPRAFDGRDWVAELRTYFSGVQFLDPFSPFGLNDDAWGIMALRAAGAPESDLAVQQAALFLVQNQNADGGWGYAAGGPSDPDDTAAFVEALTLASTAAGANEAIASAVAYLANAAEDGEGGCVAHPDFGANPDSTAWVALALLSAHRDPRAAPWGRDGGPWGCLLDHRNPDGGFRSGSAGPSNLLTTTQAVLALAAVPRGRLVPGLERPPAMLSVHPEPLVGSPAELRADGVAFAGWQSAEGAVVEGAHAEWWPLSVGPAHFTVLVVAENGVASVAPFESIVRAPSAAGSGGGAGTEPILPWVELAAPVTAERNVTTSVALSAFPGDSPVVALRVAWGDGSDSGWSARTEVEHTYAHLGVVTIEARAQDADGDVSEPQRAELRVVDAAPRLSIEGPGTAYRREAVSFTAQALDPDGPEPAITWRTDEGAATGNHITLAFGPPGPRLVEATATDAAGNVASAGHALIVLNRPPELHTLGPLVVQEGTMGRVWANATDPEEDLLDYAWSVGDERAWGPVLRVGPRAAGELAGSVNVSDPFGGWVRAAFTLHVVERLADPVTAELVIETGAPSAGAAFDAGPPLWRSTGPAVVGLPPELRGLAGAATLMAGRAADPDGPVSDVEVALGAPIPVRGLEEFVALVPALPPGTYEIAARAAGPDGVWGPWGTTTLLVAVEDEPLTLTELGPAHPRATPLSVAPALAALALALALAPARRRQP